ncbi:MAG: glucose-1-phosphate cytidylyltransferase RfbF [Phormidium sp. OSCR]|jgi:glucose-1-phosphate cytidylyltransferase|nr:MAG: glucose-1-phosphate cytidylyltransferase RfbF [Phormidium sp. OSCR]
MKVIILAGGLGTRLQEETTVKPKPMVSIGGKPVLWHIMKIYASYGFNEFAIALGYKGEVIKDYFLNYRYRTSSLTIQLLTGDVSIRQDRAEDWTVHLLDTGETTQTGGRIRRVIQSLNPKEPVMLTYGDGVANLDLQKLLDFHKSHGKLATITAVRPPARFGDIAFDGNLVTQFEEKPQSGGGWINGGFLILEPGVIDYIDADSTLFEQEPLERLAADRQLAAYKHEGFWQCMDTLRDVRLLESLWNSDHAPWKVW